MSRWNPNFQTGCVVVDNLKAWRIQVLCKIILIQYKQSASRSNKTHFTILETRIRSEYRRPYNNDSQLTTLQHFLNISQSFLPTEGFPLRLSPPVCDSSLTFPFSLKLRSVIWFGSGGSLRTLTCLDGEDIFSPRLNICRKIKIEIPTWNERQSHASYCLRRQQSSSVGSEVMRARVQDLWRPGDSVKCGRRTVDGGR